MGLTTGAGPFGERPQGRFDFDPPARIRYVWDFPRRVRAEKDGATGSLLTPSETASG